MTVALSWLLKVCWLKHSEACQTKARMWQNSCSCLLMLSRHWSMQWHLSPLLWETQVACCTLFRHQLGMLISTLRILWWTRIWWTMCVCSALVQDQCHCTLTCLWMKKDLTVVESVTRPTVSCASLWRAFVYLVLVELLTWPMIRFPKCQKSSCVRCWVRRLRCRQQSPLLTCKSSTLASLRATPWIRLTLICWNKLSIQSTSWVPSMQAAMALSNFCHDLISMMVHSFSMIPICLWTNAVVSSICWQCWLHSGQKRMTYCQRSLRSFHAWFQSLQQNQELTVVNVWWNAAYAMLLTPKCHPFCMHMEVLLIIMVILVWWFMTKFLHHSKKDCMRLWLLSWLRICWQINVTAKWVLIQTAVVVRDTSASTVFQFCTNWQSSYSMGLQNTCWLSSHHVSQNMMSLLFIQHRWPHWKNPFEHWWMSPMHMASNSIRTLAILLTCG